MTRKIIKPTKFHARKQANNRFCEGIWLIWSELGPKGDKVSLKPFWTGNLTSSAQKWQHGFTDLADRAAPYL